MSAQNLAAALAPSSAEEPGRGASSPRPGAVTADQMRTIEARSTLTMNEAQIVSGASYETLRKAIRSGRLRAKKWGTKVVIRRADLDAFMDALPDARGAA